VALLRKETCNLRHPIHLRHPVWWDIQHIYEHLNKTTKLSRECIPLYGMATISRMLKNLGLFCKRDLQKRPIFCEETYIFKRPTHRSHPISKSIVHGQHSWMDKYTAQEWKYHSGWPPTVQKSKSVVLNFLSQLSIAWGADTKISFSTECVANQSAIFPFLGGSTTVLMHIARGYHVSIYE